MNKSLWKKKFYTINQFVLFNFSYIYLLQIEKKNIEVLSTNFKVVNRFVSIPKYLCSSNIQISIYNGKFFYVVKINNNINFFPKFGELSVTRRMGLIHKSKKRNKNLKKR